MRSIIIKPDNIKSAILIIITNIALTAKALLHNIRMEDNIL